MYFKAETFDDLLRDVLANLLDDNKRISASRGDFTEIFGCVLHLTNPRARLSRSEGRGKIYSALGELFWYLSKGTELSFIDYYIPKVYHDESDDGVTVRSGYGERLFSHHGVNQIGSIINILRDKSSTRRAVVQIFDATDIERSYKSIPCTCTLQFLIRDNKLNMFVSMRSNDAYLGLPHDVFAFTMLQEIVARSVGFELGEYKHCAGSLHLYDDNREQAQNYIDEGWQSSIGMPCMPTGDPWAALSVVQGIEQTLRLHGVENIEKSNLDVYWKDICRLLAAYRASKDGDINKLFELRGVMVEGTYRMFLDARIDSLQAKFAEK